MNCEYKQKNNLPDLYNILGLNIDICSDPKCDEIIKKAYVKKAKICHPDKHPGRTDVVEIFELLTDAYNILKDNKQRTDYNHKLALNKQSSADFLKLKQEAVDYTKSLGEYTDATNEQKLSFVEKKKLLDSKHGYDSSMVDPIPTIDAKKKMDQISRTRAEQDVELKPEKLFDEGRFDLGKFNAAFDKYHDRSDNSIVTHNGVPSAWNNMNNVVSFGSFDNLDNLYVDDDMRIDVNRQNYANIDISGQSGQGQVRRSDIENIAVADYVFGHKDLEDDYYKNMKAKLRSRESDAGNFDNMKYNDFKRDDTAGYGIFDQLGFNIDDKLSFDIDDDNIAKKYEKIMSERQQQLLPTNTESVAKRGPILSHGPKNSR